MTTAFSFSTKTDAIGVNVSARSVGAHLAAKLECFSSDERTLTDELCDMLCIWLDKCSPSAPSFVPSFVLNLEKTTTKQEKKTGADLRLLIESPFGQKDCLFQAKVLDPKTGKLRYASAKGYATLRGQLLKARNICGDLAFLLVYVPSQYLDGIHQGFGSWEQSFCKSSAPGLSSIYGATVIPVNALLDPAGAWIDPVKKVPHVGGLFANGIPFAQALLELLVCLRGRWSDFTGVREQPASAYAIMPSRSHFLTLQIGVEPIDDWGLIRRSAEQALE